MNASRNYWNNVKGLLMSLVVIGHFIQVYFEKSGSHNYYFLQTILCFIYYFHMPLFVFVSGYFSKNYEKRRSRAFEDLLIPYFIAQFLWLLYQGIFNHSFDVIKNIFYPQFSLWYLLALFIWRILLPDLIKIRGILPVSVLLYVFGMFCTGINNNFAMQRAIGFLIFFLLGYFASENNINKIKKIPAWIVSCCVVLAFIGTFVILRKEIISFSTLFSVLTHGMYITSFENWGVGIIAYIIAFLSACILSIAILRLMHNRKGKLYIIGENTLPLYISHGFIVHIFNSWYSHIQLQNEIQRGGYIVTTINYNNYMFLM